MDFIQHYKELYKQEPSSKVFAPLAEAYRRAKVLDEAQHLCEEGIKNHPQFSGGYLTLGRIYIDRDDLQSALPNIERACQLSPDNILARAILAEIYLKLHEVEKALNEYKMVLFLNPEDERAAKAVRKLEVFVVKDYNTNDYDWQFVKDPENDAVMDLESVLSLIDIHIIKSDFVSARALVEQALNQYSSTPELSYRQKLLEQSEEEDGYFLDNHPSPKIQTLQNLLKQVQTKR